MESFYGYLTKGLPKHKALRQAKIDYLSSHPEYLQSPFYWAAFIPIGDMQPIELNKYSPWWAILFTALVLLFIAFIIIEYRKPSV